MSIISATIIILLLLLLLLLIISPILLGAPYYPTNNNGVRAILKLADVKKGEKAIDLGSGDGRLVIALAKEGAETHGIEINPVLVLISRIRIRKANLHGKAFIQWGSFWNVKFNEYDIITIFGIKGIMGKLEKRLKNEGKTEARILSHAFKFPTWKARKEINGNYLYKK